VEYTVVIAESPAVAHSHHDTFLSRRESVSSETITVADYEHILLTNQADTDKEIQIYTERYNIRHYQTPSRRTGTANY